MKRFQINTSQQYRMFIFYLFLLGHILLCPFTKVEESFNMQAIHDYEFLLVRNNFSLDKFDHHEFPGVVPRTFIGASFISIVTTPILKLLETLNFMESGLLALYLSRIVLASIVWYCLCILKISLEKKFGSETGKWFQFVCCSQFHLVFYLGRPLPNTFALALCSVALARWLNGEWAPAIAWLTFCTVVFRCDTVILTGIVALLMLITKEAGFIPMVVNGISTGFVSLCLTVGYDSVMWKKLLWPEGMVLFFNTVMNKSSEWGTMPFHWYYTSALPKALLICFPLSILCVFPGVKSSGISKWVDTQNLVYFLIPALGYVSTYSILPHKEVRFLFQVFPFLSAAAAVTMGRLQRQAFPKKAKENMNKKGFVWFYLLAIGGLILSTVVSSLFVFISSKNYPGGYAMLELQTHHLSTHGTSKATAHYCTYAAMSGITRFLEEGTYGIISYSKQEDEEFLKTRCLEANFQYLIMEVGDFTDQCKIHYKKISSIEGEPKLLVKNMVKSDVWKSFVTSGQTNILEILKLVQNQFISVQETLILLERK